MTSPLKVCENEGEKEFRREFEVRRKEKWEEEGSNGCLRASDSIFISQMLLTYTYFIDALELLSGLEGLYFAPKDGAPDANLRRTRHVLQSVTVPTKEWHRTAGNTAAFGLRSVC